MRLSSLYLDEAMKLNERPAKDACIPCRICTATVNGNDPRHSHQAPPRPWNMADSRLSVYSHGLSIHPKTHLDRRSTSSFVPAWRSAGSNPTHIEQTCIRILSTPTGPPAEHKANTLASTTSRMHLYFALHRPYKY
ncbi:hypothetical protein B9J09_03605 [Xylella fastidiosa subsp. pauca]|uniref:Uncharacterized protein n=1 Tax=Xylella fastidiosa (strain 9a5c) TaxID=160492 RepID=Q9PB73_XYLFA|nr:hypothetical protein XF_2271 [Xylella fastidiosa 9a5c]ARO68251.1 hypothetical protein B9J09_03605 [Xylella fastidiosa subsp. pauca]TNW25092.1 hypothetical protein EIP74_00680 [Xylella fastidiosa subsp. pauca]